MRIEPEIAGVSVVLIGNFNPSIFTPAWFEWHKLLPQKTVDVANLGIVHPQISNFNADWLNIQVVTERFQINTTQAPYVRLQDLAVRIFSRVPAPIRPLVLWESTEKYTFRYGPLASEIGSAGCWHPTGPWGGLG